MIVRHKVGDGDTFSQKNCGLGRHCYHASKLEQKKPTVDLFLTIAIMAILKSCIVIKRLAVLFLLRLWFPGSNKSLYLAKEIFLYQNIYVNLTLRWVLFLILLILAVIAVKENCMNTKLRSSFGTRTAMKFGSQFLKNLNSLVVI